MRHALSAILAIGLFASLLAAPSFAKDGPREATIDVDADPGTIVIKTAMRKLYLLTGNGQALEYDIAVGRPSEQWFGRSWVSRKRPHPTWVPTPDMREKHPDLPDSVGPGPKNPLGERAMNLGWTSYRIHGTNSPHSIGRAASSGCFRMRNADVKDLYDRVHVGAEVIVER
ncbi:L,D-transpeptidase [Jiella sp. MQZ9-1]|uniref:L,D-transpeptidase n=1 Tax=Jiella flava TaxID=2816857 RepID=A0A939JX68_9HYPH|nr:L,D-transpeptidase [Jiella flava]MBO0663051.1 L,D-transpeptidase [Jiella flava]MCD2471470.1 L,D-transpeptidase [Jiella flava]